MASDLVTSSVEQRCIIEFSVRLKIKSREILCKLNAHNGEETFSRPNVLFRIISFLKAVD